MIQALEVKKLEKSYRGRKIVRGVSVQVKNGEVVGLLGPNGAGKTTTFYMVVGLIRPEQGRVILDGTDITKMPMYQRARHGIGYLPQEPSVFRKLTVAENLMAILETMDISAIERVERQESLLNELGIAHLANSRAYTLSGGERRRLEIARALTLSPKFILLDEPFRRHRSPRRAGHPGDRLAPKEQGYRHPDHRSQRARNACDHRPGLYHQRGKDHRSRDLG